MHYVTLDTITEQLPHLITAARDEWPGVALRDAGGQGRGPDLDTLHRHALQVTRGRGENIMQRGVLRKHNKMSDSLFKFLVTLE